MPANPPPHILLVNQPQPAVQALRNRDIERPKCQATTRIVGCRCSERCIFMLSFAARATVHSQSVGVGAG